MLAAGLADARKAGEPVGDDLVAAAQVGAGPGGNGLEGESRQRGQLGTQRVAGGIQRYRRHERHLVFGASFGLAADEFAAKVGIVHLALSAKDVPSLPFNHRLHKLVVDPPSGGVADSQVALQGQGRQPGLGLADQVQGQKPRRQGQLGALKQGAGDQRGLLAAGRCTGRPWACPPGTGHDSSPWHTSSCRPRPQDAPGGGSGREPGRGFLLIRSWVDPLGQPSVISGVP